MSCFSALKCALELRGLWKTWHRWDGLTRTLRTTGNHPSKVREQEGNKVSTAAAAGAPGPATCWAQKHESSPVHGEMSEQGRREVEQSPACRPRTCPSTSASNEETHIAPSHSSFPTLLPMEQDQRG